MPCMKINPARFGRALGCARLRLNMETQLQQQKPDRTNFQVSRQRGVCLVTHTNQVVPRGGSKTTTNFYLENKSAH